MFYLKKNFILIFIVVKEKDRWFVGGLCLWGVFYDGIDLGSEEF